MNTAAGKSYNELCERHKADYTNLFNRVKLTLNPHAPMTLQYPAVTDLPTYQRLARYRKGNPDYNGNGYVVEYDRAGQKQHEYETGVGSCAKFFDSAYKTAYTE